MSPRRSRNRTHTGGGVPFSKENIGSHQDEETSAELPRTSQVTISTEAERRRIQDTREKEREKRRKVQEIEAIIQTSNET